MKRSCRCSEVLPIDVLAASITFSMNSIGKNSKNSVSASNFMQFSRFFSSQGMDLTDFFKTQYEIDETLEEFEIE